MSSDKAEKAFNFAGDQWIKKVVRKGNGHLAQEGCQCKLRINGLIKLEIPFLGQWKDRFVFDSDTLLTHAIVHLVTLSLIEGELCELKNHEVVFSIELIECTVVRPSTQRFTPPIDWLKSAPLSFIEHGNSVYEMRSKTLNSDQRSDDYAMLTAVYS